MSVFNCHTVGVQTKICYRDQGVQCSLLENPSTSCQSEEGIDWGNDSSETDSEDEPDSSYGEDSEDEDNNENYSICK